MEFNNTTNMLKESLLFEARNARVPRNTIEEVRGSASSSSTQYYSIRIYNVMELVKGMALSEVDFAIEASKDHWTELEPKYYSATNLLENPHNMGITTNRTVEDSTSFSDLTRMSGTEREATNVDVELYEENMAFMKSLQREYHFGAFFVIDGDDGEWVLGRKIGEGAQATIYEVNEFIMSNGEKVIHELPCVLKVFNAGYSLVDLRKQWPLTLLYKLNPYQGFFSMQEGLFYKKIPTYCNLIHQGRLLKDGRFAFQMAREWGDLRKLLDVRMQYNGNQRPPFMMPDGNYLEFCMLMIMYQIARGMRDMHKESTLHRDLKASNVLICCIEENSLEDLESRLEFESIYTRRPDFYCAIADFECSIGVVGTGFWRAPEILKVVKNRSWSTMPEVFTPKSDVYSYAMTCYEIITGFIPFEDIEDGETSCEDVIEGKRPKLPKHLKPCMKELMCKCWHMHPSQRPTFEEIVELLSSLIKGLE